MSDWGLMDLTEWDDRICEIAKAHGLDWYPITYETCDYFEMLGNMAYHGMPTHYGHWSYGKSFEVQRQQYQAGMTGLPYELIINSNPCISYLMKENPLHLQILIMAHCVGHSDFFKNNRSFSFTRADTVVPRMRNAKKRIQSYIEDPSIGIEAVEAVIDSAHALSYQVPRHPTELEDLSEKRAAWLEYHREDLNSGDMSEYDYNKIPQEPEYDILGFIAQYARKMKDWERDIIEIIRDEAYYFMPQIRTKTMNEGWACFWHYKILHELDLPQQYHIPFLKSHNQVVRPHVGSINPYHLGFYLFNKIEERHGLAECFLARDVHHDESFIRQYLTQEDCEELNLFSFNDNPDTIEITEVSDDEGWKHVKNILMDQIGGSSIPQIYVEDVEDDVLILHHEHDGQRDLEISHATKVIHHTMELWKSEVKLITIVDDAPYEI